MGSRTFGPNKPGPASQTFVLSQAGQLVLQRRPKKLCNTKTHLFEKGNMPNLHMEDAQYILCIVFASQTKTGQAHHAANSLASLLPSETKLA